MSSLFIFDPNRPLRRWSGNRNGGFESPVIWFRAPEQALERERRVYGELPRRSQHDMDNSILALRPSGAA
jgi:hypothetical protein